MAFEEYAEYYDLFYRDKNYKSETDYVNSLIKQYCPGAKIILDLGCGTGRHDFHLVEKGYSVVGVDSSKNMLKVARNNMVKLNASKNNISFYSGDIRDFQSNKKFDVVLSLFHVMSYQITNDDLQKVFGTAAYHLKQNGIFIFDCWYGPGVLTDPPGISIKKMESGNYSYTRIGESIMHLNKNRVDVDYTVLIINKTSKKVKEIHECHSMRYLFQPEIESFIKNSNLELIASKKFMEEGQPGIADWNVCFIAKRGET